jgi:hypothetical protein
LVHGGGIESGRGGGEKRQGREREEEAEQVFHREMPGWADEIFRRGDERRKDAVLPRETWSGHGRKEAQKAQK